MNPTRAIALLKRGALCLCQKRNWQQFSFRCSPKCKSTNHIYWHRFHTEFMSRFLCFMPFISIPFSLLFFPSYFCTNVAQKVKDDSSAKPPVGRSSSSEWCRNSYPNDNWKKNSQREPLYRSVRIFWTSDRTLNLRLNNVLKSTLFFDFKAAPPHDATCGCAVTARASVVK